MSSLASLALLSGGMCVGTLVCGMIPLSLPLSRRMLRFLEVYGAGLLVGAAVTIVVPEGAKALFSEQANESHFQPTRTSSADWAWSAFSKRGEPGTQEPRHEGEVSNSNPETLFGTSILVGFLIMFLIDQLTSSSGGHDHGDHAAERGHSEAHHYPRSRPETLRLARSFSKDGHRHGDSSKPDARTVFDAVETSRANVAGANSKHARSQSSQGSSASSISDIESFPADYSSVDASKSHGNWLGSPTRNGRGDQPESPLLAAVHSNRVSMISFRRASMSSIHPRMVPGFGQALTSIVGLVIHAAADGIAMGASAGSGDRKLTWIVFIAIMVHKAPASFGLCTLLMAQRLHRGNIRKAIAVFSLSTPVGAIITFLFLSTVLGSDPSSDEGAAIEPRHIGTALSFSGGTFLFVAMHAITELASASADLTYSDDSPPVLGRFGRIALVLLGSATPKLLQSLAGHGH
ncbi:Zinc/iron permease [Violaceomyces palustris]|uniref:Zinc/iron permease n=1 Tax=Violaceomyces palustris TaxID=1673888 RepID=A0ACD0NN44_9BASI|nr:Zinc/iron permease [Violaceomyces palustris]